MNLKELLKDSYKEGMSLEEIDKALEGVTLPTDNSLELSNLKEALSKANSEVSNYKKQLQEKMSKEELEAKENAEKFEKLQKDYEALLRKNVIAENQAQLLAIGYDEKLAKETAEAMADGKTEIVFKNQSKFAENLKQSVKADLLKNTPKPSTDNQEKVMTKEEFRKMSPQERYKFASENPDEYKQLYEKGEN